MIGLPGSVLIPSARMPRSLPLVRAFGEAGVEVHTCDTGEDVASAPTSHSRWVTETFAAPSPSGDPAGYVAAVADHVRDHGIELVMPHFEEIFYLAARAEEIPAPLFAAPFPTLRLLHDKARFMTFCAEIGVPTPATDVVSTPAGLAAAVARRPGHIAKPAYSRGGLVFLADTGPRAGERAVEDCVPTEENPWLVQEYVDGVDMCSFSIAREGRVVLHCPYRPTIEAPGGFGVQFSTVEDFGSLAVAEQVAAATGLTGSFGLDFRRAEDRLVVLECNARCTNGVYLVPHEWIVEAVCGPAPELRVAPPGRTRQWDVAILMPKVSGLSVPGTLHELLTVADPYVDRHDLMPFLEYLADLRHYVGPHSPSEEEMAHRMLGDLIWDGADLRPDQVAAGPGATP